MWCGWFGVTCAGGGVYRSVMVLCAVCGRFGKVGLEVVVWSVFVFGVVFR